MTTFLSPKLAFVLACLAALAVVGGSCGFAIQFGPDAAATMALTLLAMTLIAVVDPRG